jgi:hypothetical protein
VVKIWGALPIRDSCLVFPRPDFVHLNARKLSQREKKLAKRAITLTMLGGGCKHDAEWAREATQRGRRGSDAKRTNGVSISFQ